MDSAVCGSAILPELVASGAVLKRVKGATTQFDLSGGPFSSSGLKNAGEGRQLLHTVVYYTLWNLLN